MSSTHVLSGAMQDGRFFTTYAPVCQLNAKVAQSASVESWNSTQYRDYLQKNGLAVVKSFSSPTPCGTLACADHGMSVAAPASPDISPPYTDDPEL